MQLSPRGALRSQSPRAQARARLCHVSPAMGEALRRLAAHRGHSMRFARAEAVTSPVNVIACEKVSPPPLCRRPHAAIRVPSEGDGRQLDRNHEHGVCDPDHRRRQRRDFGHGRDFPLKRGLPGVIPSNWIGSWAAGKHTFNIGKVELSPPFKNCHGLAATTNFWTKGPMSFRGGRAALAQFISIWAGVNIEARTTPSGLAAKA